MDECQAKVCCVQMEPSCCFFFDQLFRDGRFIFGFISTTDKQLNNHIEILKTVHFDKHLRKQPCCFEMSNFFIAFKSFLLS